MLANSLLMGKPDIYSKHLGEQIIHLGAMTFMLPENIDYEIFKVDKAHIARPDLISKVYYGSDSYGDLICKLNGISNPFEINEGDIIILPTSGMLDRFFILDTFNDLESGQDGSKKNRPTPKARTEKRKPNEAVIGDTRFKVDKEHRVIIY